MPGRISGRGDRDTAIFGNCSETRLARGEEAEPRSPGVSWWGKQEAGSFVGDFDLFV